jgi:hypothetical protein
MRSINDRHSVLYTNSTVHITHIHAPEGFTHFKNEDTPTLSTRVDTKWRFQFFAKYDYRFLLDVIIAIIATFFAKAIIAISQLSLNILLE